jgi:hypothetical protein
MRRAESGEIVSGLSNVTAYTGRQDKDNPDQVWYSTVDRNQVADQTILKKSDPQ